jgi:prepilin-type N-terminal cleavage/methylation domain-containing protein
MKNRRRQSGFSLMETLISLIVFTVGFMGVTQYTGNALKRSADDNSRAVSLNTMTQLLTPLYAAAASTPADFKTALDRFSTGTGMTVTGNNAKDTYTIKVLQAQDDAGNSIINVANPETWLSPITVGVVVSYTGTTGTIVSKAPYTFLLK